MSVSWVQACGMGAPSGCFYPVLLWQVQGFAWEGLNTSDIDSYATNHPLNPGYRHHTLSASTGHANLQPVSDVHEKNPTRPAHRRIYSQQPFANSCR